MRDTLLLGSLEEGVQMSDMGVYTAVGDLLTLVRSSVQVQCRTDSDIARDDTQLGQLSGPKFRCADERETGHAPRTPVCAAIRHNSGC